MPPARFSEREVEREMQLLDDPIRLHGGLYGSSNLRPSRVQIKAALLPGQGALCAACSPHQQLICARQWHGYKRTTEEPIEQDAGIPVGNSIFFEYIEMYRELLKNSYDQGLDGLWVLILSHINSN